MNIRAIKEWIPFFFLVSLTAGISTLCQIWSIHPSAPIIGINLLASLAVLSFANKKACVIIFLLQCILSIILTSASSALKEPLTLTAILNGMDYALDFGTSIYIYIQVYMALFFAICLILQLLLVYRINWNVKRTKVGVISLIALFSVFAISLTSLPLSAFWPNEKTQPGEIVNWNPPERRSLHKRGYLTTYLIEFFTGYTLRVKHLQPIMDTPNGTEDIPALKATGKIIFIQVESLDYDLLNATVGDEYVMPFLHDLQKAAIVIPIDGAKKLGSANSDFEIFTGNIASSNYIHYTFTKTFPNSLLSEISKKISPSFAFHGMPYFYMNQGPAYTAQGVEHVLCLEEMQREGITPRHMWGDGVIADQDMFPLALSKIPQSGNFFQFIITMNMHTFENPRDVCPQMHFTAGDDHAFYSCSRSTDDAIRDYITHIPAGTLVAIWGDHRSYSRDGDGKIPFIAFIKGEEHPFDGSHLQGMTRSKMHFYLEKIIQPLL